MCKVESSGFSAQQRTIVLYFANILHGLDFILQKAGALGCPKNLNGLGFRERNNGYMGTGRSQKR